MFSRGKSAVDRTMLDLTIPAMAQFAVERNFPVELILNTAAMAAGFMLNVFQGKPFTLFVLLVGCLVLPIVFSCCGLVMQLLWIAHGYWKIRLSQSYPPRPSDQKWGVDLVGIWCCSRVQKRNPLLRDVEMCTLF